MLLVICERFCYEYYRKKIEKSQIEKIQADRNFPEFNPGDTIKVDVKVIEGTRERVQAFEGVCIAKSGSGINRSLL